MHPILLTPTLQKPAFVNGTHPATENILHQMAFNTSQQANIITTVKTGKIITANLAACNLLGYTLTELLSRNFASIFDTEGDGIKPLLKSRNKNGHATAIINCVKKNKEIIACEVTSAVFLYSENDEKAITTITDLSAGIKLQQKIDTVNRKAVATAIIAALKVSDARLVENNRWLKYIAKASYDVMWDWDIVTGTIYVGESISEVFGYKVVNNIITYKDFIACIPGPQQQAVENKLSKALLSRNKTWKDAYSIIRADSSVATVTSRAGIIRDTKGKALRMIGAVQDVSRIQELERRLKDRLTNEIAANTHYEENFRLMFNSSYDVLFDSDIEANHFTVSHAFEKDFGYPIKEKMTAEADWLPHIHTDDRQHLLADYARMLSSEDAEWKISYRFFKADGSTANVITSAIILRTAAGRAYRIIGYMHDMSKQVVLEERLLQEILLKEKQIAEACEDAKDTERSDIGKELHDNINQLLAASKMYLDMAKRDGSNSGKYLGKSSEYTVEAIEEIRKLTKGLTTDIIMNLGLCEAIEKTTKDIMQAHLLRIAVNCTSFSEEGLHAKFKLNLFRIIQEQLNNILKHARASKVVITLQQQQKSLKLLIVDNGAGFDTTAKRKGIGLANIISRAAAYNGIAQLVSQPGKGCTLKVVFPVQNI